MTLDENRIRQALLRTEQLPACPRVVIELEEYLAEDEPSLVKVGDIISNDPSISAKVLRLANSSFYAPAQAISSVRQAVLRLGLEEVRRLVLVSAFVGNMPKLQLVSSSRFWAHCVAVGLAIPTIAEMSVVDLPRSDQELAFTAGLLHDIGALALMTLFPKEYEQMLTDLDETDHNLDEYERMQWGISHGEVGQILLESWKLPESVCALVRFHHDPWAAPEPLKTLVQFVNVADFACSNEGFGWLSRLGQGFDRGSWDSLGLEVQQIPEIIAGVTEQGDRSRELIELAS